MSTPYWIYLTSLISFELEKSPLVSCILVLVNLKCDFSLNIIAWVCADPSAVCPVLNHFDHAGMVCHPSNYHSQSRILSCLRASTDRKQVSNQMTDETLAFTATLAFLLPSHFSHLLCHNISFSLQTTLFSLPDSLCWAWKISVKTVLSDFGAANFSHVSQDFFLIMACAKGSIRDPLGLGFLYTLSPLAPHYPLYRSPASCLLLALLHVAAALTKVTSGLLTQAAVTDRGSVLVCQSPWWEASRTLSPTCLPCSTTRLQELILGAKCNRYFSFSHIT